jgi:hypothetical protein
MSRKLGLVLAVVVSPLVGPREASSQESARWVDPPAENEEKVTYPDPPPPEPTETNSIVVEEAAQPSPAVPLPPPRVAADDVKAGRGSTEAAVRPEVRPGTRRTRSPGDRRKVSGAGTPKQEVQRASRSRTSAPEARRRAAEAPRSAPSQPGGPVPRTIDEALAAGLPVTTVRTYILPDGRRVEVITEIAPTGPGPRSRTY